MLKILTYIQIISAVLIVILILLQERSSGAGGFLGGMESTVYQTRRGVEKFLFAGTITSIVVFTLISLYQLLI